MRNNDQVVGVREDSHRAGVWRYGRQFVPRLLLCYLRLAYHYTIIRWICLLVSGVSRNDLQFKQPYRISRKIIIILPYPLIINRLYFREGITALNFGMIVWSILLKADKYSCLLSSY
jgi:hypothetical protein